MCGLAGRILMELGFHQQDVARQILIIDQQWVEYTVTAASIVILDRQWSAAIGLPNNFSNTDFDLDHGSLVCTNFSVNRIKLYLTRPCSG